MTNEKKTDPPEQIDQLDQPTTTYESFARPPEEPRNIFNDKPYPKKTRQELEATAEYLPVIEIIKTCTDPELGLDIWTQGLIYDISVTDTTIIITMTLTSPLCPYGPMMVDEIETKLNELGKEVVIDVVFSPAWQPNEELKEMLGM